MKKIVALLLAAIMVLGLGAGIAFAQKTEEKESAVQVACVGDSITAAGYPEELGALLGDGYQVTNYGQPGAQMQGGERFSYMDLDIYQESLDADADYYIVMLGSNDTMSTTTWDPDQFRTDYTALINSYLALGDDTQVYTMLPPAVFKEENSRALSSRIDLDILDLETRPLIQEISEELGVSTIDLYSLTKDHPEWLSDGLHPNEDGNKEIAGYIYDTIFADAE